MRSLERILVRQPNWLGDALMARPALHALRRAHPRAEITVVGSASLVALLAPEGNWNRAEAWPPDPDLSRRLRVAGFDAALVLPPSFSSAWLALRAGARRRVGFASDGRSILLTDAVRRPARGETHLSREYLALAAELGAREVPLPLLPLRAGAAEEAEALLGAVGMAGRPAAILGPGAAYGPAKRWEAGRFVAVGRRLAREGMAVLVCGTGADQEVCETVSAGIGEAARCLAGATTLPVQAALCAGADVVVSNDSGLAHLAGATGARSVVVFGSTSSAWTAPLGPQVRVVQRAPVCSPCFRRTCAIGYGCLEAVGVESVVRAALEPTA
jgi:heptosyltransferase-2